MYKHFIFKEVMNQPEQDDGDVPDSVEPPPE